MVPQKPHRKHFRDSGLREQHEKEKNPHEPQKPQQDKAMFHPPVPKAHPLCCPNPGGCHGPGLQLSASSLSHTAAAILQPALSLTLRWWPKSCPGGMAEATTSHG